LRFQAYARHLIPLLLLVLASCEKKSESILDSSLSVGRLEYAILQPGIINTDTVMVGSERKGTDTLKLTVTARAALRRSDIGSAEQSVEYELWNQDRTSLHSAGKLRDDGVSPDHVKGDAVFAGRIEFQIVRSVVGTFQADVWATSQYGLTSPAHRIPLSLVRLNQPPQLSDLIAPDTLRLGTQNQFLLLQVRATDPDGLADIKRVSFNSFRPDGSTSSGNPFAMYDDGSEAIISQPDIRSGDKTKGDGIYSLTVVLPPTTTAGLYRFVFQAIDRSDAASNTITHHISVRP